MEVCFERIPPPSICRRGSTETAKRLRICRDNRSSGSLVYSASTPPHIGV